MSIRLSSMALGFALTVASTTAHASCQARDTLIETLQGKYSEQLAARGLQEMRSGSAIVEIWASEDRGTFTVLLTSANGQSCIISSGTHWFPQDAEKLADIPKDMPG